MQLTEKNSDFFDSSKRILILLDSFRYRINCIPLNIGDSTTCVQIIRNFAAQKNFQVVFFKANFGFGNPEWSSGAKCNGIFEINDPRTICSDTLFSFPSRICCAPFQCEISMVRAEI